MEYLEYIDFLVPYMLLFHEKIKQEVQDLRSKFNNKIYRPVLLTTRAEQEHYFL
jgi:hypothetical protein